MWEDNFFSCITLYKHMKEEQTITLPELKDPTLYIEDIMVIHSIFIHTKAFYDANNCADIYNESACQNSYKVWVGSQHPTFSWFTLEKNDATGCVIKVADHITDTDSAGSYYVTHLIDDWRSGASVQYA